MKIDAWAATDTGREREHNEDSFLVDERLGLFVVADGMGGHAAGEIASSVCVEKVHDIIAAQPTLLEQYRQGQGRLLVINLVERAIHEACRTIFERAQAEPEKRGMGTTCSLLLLAGERGVIAHVGDSRIYLVRQGKVHQLSEDHSLLNELLRHGHMTEAEFDDSSFKDLEGAVTRAVGVYESVLVDTLDFDVLPGDRFLVCSDGLHSYLEDHDIIEIVGGQDGEAANETLIDLANDGGGQDNITSIVVQVGQPGLEDLRTQDVHQRLDVLHKMPLFRHLNYKELVRVMNIAEVREVTDGEILISEGSAAGEMFIILDGTVRLHKAETTIGELSGGAHFGEMALVDSSPRSASATAVGTVRLLAIRRRDLFDIIRYYNKLSTKILWSLVQVLTVRLRHTTAELSGALADASLPDLTQELIFEDSDLNKLPRP